VDAVDHRAERTGGVARAESVGRGVRQGDRPALAGAVDGGRVGDGDPSALRLDDERADATAGSAATTTS
jgi:hypothetical protein